MPVYPGALGVARRPQTIEGQGQLSSFSHVIDSGTRSESTPAWCFAAIIVLSDPSTLLPFHAELGLDYARGKERRAMITSLHSEKEGE